MTTPAAPLVQCRSWTRWLGASGWCRDCTHGWLWCMEHGRLEHARSVHKRVTVADVLDAMATPTVRSETGPELVESGAGSGPRDVAKRPGAMADQQPERTWSA